uniref:Uncharacterized protein n=1 Tax=Arundo donax TaxID=35708 RepID=A0A0A9BCS9_ARUDO
MMHKSCIQNSMENLSHWCIGGLPKMNRNGVPMLRNWRKRKTRV